MRVPRKTQAPLTLPGTLSTAGHCDQSSAAIVGSLLFRSMPQALLGEKGDARRGDILASQRPGEMGNGRGQPQECVGDRSDAKYLTVVARGRSQGVGLDLTIIFSRTSTAPIGSPARLGYNTKWQIAVCGWPFLIQARTAFGRAGSRQSGSFKSASGWDRRRK